MKTNTNIKTEYAPHGLTVTGKWRVITSRRFTKEQLAKDCIEAYKKDCDKLPTIYERYREYKVMKRTIVTIISEWEEA